MIASADLQLDFFQKLKNYIPAHLSLVDELADLLHLSYDSIYRRLRGEKPLSLDELKRICDHFQVSIDQLLQLKSNSVIFFRPGDGEMKTDFKEYLKGILRQMKYFNSFSERNLFYLCKDAPIFHFYQFPEIAAFKTFFWIRSVLNLPDYQQELFSFEKHAFEECYLLGQEVIREYNNIDSVEMWNYESFNSTINQIEFYRDAGLFRSRADLEGVVHSLIRVYDYLQSLAESGVKPSSGNGVKRKIQFYINEIIIGSNTILVNLDEQRASILTYSVLKYLVSRDEELCNETFTSFDNLRSKSILISQAGEKERIRYFNTLRNKANRVLE